MIETFKQALDQAGLSTKESIIADGKLHRFHVEGDKPGAKNGAYVLFDDGIAAGFFMCWKRGISETWCAKGEKNLTSAERAEFHKRMAKARAEREAEERQRRIEAQAKALNIWKIALPAPDDHPYLIKKCVKNHGLRLYKEALVIPLRDAAGTLHSLQFIDADGNKRFLSGGRKNGCYFGIGTPIDRLCIAEGYATAASIYEATGDAVAVAFDAGNLLPVAKALRVKFPHIELCLCADNDLHTPGNPGVTKAREAAASVGALLAVPPTAGDFNDLYNGGAYAG